MGTEWSQAHSVEEYGSEYKKRSNAISIRIKNLKNSSGARGLQVQDVEKELSHAEALIQKMEGESSKAPAASSHASQLSIIACKKDLAALREQLRVVAAQPSQMRAGDRTAGSAEDVGIRRADLGLGASGNQLGSAAPVILESSQRARMLAATQRLQDTDKALSAAQEQLHQAEDTGVKILATLQSQRETLEKSHQTLRGTTSVLKNLPRS